MAKSVVAKREPAVAGIFGWTEVADTQFQYDEDPQTPMWGISMVEKGVRSGIVFEPRALFPDGFKLLAVSDVAVRQPAITFKMMCDFAHRGPVEQRLLWLAFCSVNRIEGDHWLSQVECQLKQHLMNSPPRVTKELLMAVEKRLAQGQPLTCEEILGSLQYKEE